MLVYVWEAHENKVLIPNLRMHSMPIFELNVPTFYLKKATMVHVVDPLQQLFFMPFRHPNMCCIRIT
jgi:hypothetical protein